MSFDVSRLRRADQIAGIGAVALFIFMFFFKWYGASANSSTGGGVNISSSADAWTSFHNSRWIWIITVIVALGSVAISAGVLALKSPVQRGVLVAGLGALSTIFILYRMIHHPSGGASSSFGAVHYSYSYGIKIGIWLGLVAAAAVTYGGYLGMQAEGTSIADVRGQASEALSNLTSSAGTGSGGGTSAGSAPPIPPSAGTSAGAGAPPLPPPADSSGTQSTSPQE
jgi:hypothetical protein